MSVTSADVRNLNASRAQALQALQTVSERLGDILGDTDLPGDITRRNENGDLVNEEGLPIIDITEPIDDLDTPSLSAATEDDEVIEEDNYPEPISKLSPEALAVSRKHRDKILDLLEQEEEREERKSHQEHQLEMKRKRDAARVEMQKRMLTQGSDLAKRREAKELEKKMAKALISGLGEPETVKSKVAVAQADGKTKKVVTFADPPSAGSEALPSTKQQAIVPAILPASKSRTTGLQKQPMKMEVVERNSLQAPVPTPGPLEKLNQREPTRDSDDESDLDVASDNTVAESEEDDLVLSAQQHRELALEYHRRREALASNAGAMKIDDDEMLGDGASWDKEEVPLDATADALAKSVKLGKLVDGQLVAGEDEQDVDREEREEEEIRKLLQKSIEEYSGIAAQVMGPAAKGSTSVIDSPSFAPTPSNHPAKRQTVVMVNNVQERSTDRVSSVNNSSDVQPRRVSRFKADRSGD
ncbi:hypothetical protein JB92DRAFT_3098010 [Gautieria morchelliformis]|nr:hypothetical protein JB92DRAFT_3098010 [Gautieria morchelliformis]